MVFVMTYLFRASTDEYMELTGLLVILDVHQANLKAKWKSLYSDIIAAKTIDDKSLLELAKLQIKIKYNQCVIRFLHDLAINYEFYLSNGEISYAYENQSVLAAFFDRNSRNKKALDAIINEIVNKPTDSYETRVMQNDYLLQERIFAVLEVMINKSFNNNGNNLYDVFIAKQYYVDLVYLYSFLSGFSLIMITTLSISLFLALLFNDCLPAIGLAITIVVLFVLMLVFLGLMQQLLSRYDFLNVQYLKTPDFFTNYDDLLVDDENRIDQKLPEDVNKQLIEKIKRLVDIPLSQLAKEVVETEEDITESSLTSRV